jgi:UDP-2-acetamido-3-amino-2,3-dideoxy-glucuronate N-acetyltransferase
VTAEDDVYIHPTAICETNDVGRGSRIWAHCHLLPGAIIGPDANINDGVFIENDVVVGARATIKCGVYLWDGLRLGDDVFVGPNATFTNDPMPRSKHFPERFVETVVEDGASIGANATILPGLRIGRGAMVGAGSVVTRDVPPFAVVYGNPARIRGYVGASSAPERLSPSSSAPPVPFNDMAVRLVPITKAADLRGRLAAMSFPAEVPFAPTRCFVVYDVPSKDVRGEHAHRTCEQFLVCLRGSVAVVVDDGRQRTEVTLNDPGLGLYVPAMVWGIQYRYSNDALLLVLASHVYDDGDYIRDYNEFIALTSER